MKKLAILLILTTIFLSGCGESHTYSGILKRTGLGETEGKVKITVQKQSETEATMTIKSDGESNSGLFLTECQYPIKLKREEVLGKAWNPDSCYLKDDSVRITAGSGNLTIDGKQMEMKVTTDLATDRETRFEFKGTE